MSTSSRIAVVTGANSGLGLHLSKFLYNSGAFTAIVLACRDCDKANVAIDEIRNSSNASSSSTNSNTGGRTPPSLHTYQLDLVCPSSIRAFVCQIGEVCPTGALHLLVNNAGIMSHKHKLVNQIEIHFATNHLGHFYLTNLLIEDNMFANDAKILNITSGFYTKCDSLSSAKELSSIYPHRQPDEYYGLSKLANCLHAFELAKRVAANEATKDMRVVAIRPGFVRGTALGRHTSPVLRLLAFPFIWYFAKNLDQGIATAVHCINSQNSELSSGSLYYDGQVVPYTEAVNDDNAKKMWEMSEELLASCMRM